VSRHAAVLGLGTRGIKDTIDRAFDQVIALDARRCRVADGHVAYVEELPGANTHGDTLDEARDNLREAVELVLESNRALAREDAGSEDVIREPLRFATG
jgi:predicted RNase H-like HicB family nuclease